MLLTLFNRLGFFGEVDFLYLPMDFANHASLGYAFVNLTTAAATKRFWKIMQGFGRWDVPTKKLCTVDWSFPVQGLEANLDRFKNSPVMHPEVADEYKPVRLKNGVREPFPAPSKAIKFPRRWKPSGPFSSEMKNKPFSHVRKHHSALPAMRDC